MIFVSYLCFFVGFAINLALYFQKSRTLTLWYSFAASLLFGVFFLISISTTGAIVCAVAMFNTAYQALQSDEILRATKAKRLAVACLCASLGSIIYQQSSADLLPVYAFIINCLAEIQETQRGIYIFYGVSLIFWTMYGVAYEDYLYVLCNLILLAINAWVVFRPINCQRH